MDDSFRVLSESEGSDNESPERDIDHNENEEQTPEDEGPKHFHGNQFLTIREEPENLLMNDSDMASEKSASEDKAAYGFDNPILYEGKEEPTPFRNMMFDEALTNERIDEVDEDKEEDILIADELALEQEKIIRECAGRMLGFFLKGFMKRYLRDVFDKIYDVEPEITESELKERKIVLISKLNLKLQLKVQLALTRRFNCWKTATKVKANASRRSVMPPVVETQKPKPSPANIFEQMKMGVSLAKAIKGKGSAKTSEIDSAERKSNKSDQSRGSVTKAKGDSENQIVQIMSYIAPPDIDLKEMLGVESIPPSNSGKIVEASSTQNENLSQSPKNSSQDTKQAAHPLNNLLQSISIGKKPRQSSASKSSASRPSVTPNANLEPKPRDSNVPKAGTAQPTENSGQKTGSKIDAKALGNLNALFAKKPAPQASTEPSLQQTSTEVTQQEIESRTELEGFARVPNTKILVAQGPDVLPIPDIDLRAHMPDLPPAPEVSQEPVVQKSTSNKIDVKAFGNLNALFGKKAPQTENPEPVAVQKPASKIDTNAFGNLNALFGKKAPLTESAEPEQKPAGKINTAAFGGLNALFAKKGPVEEPKPVVEAPEEEKKRKVLLAKGPNVLPVPDSDLREHMPDLPDASSIETEEPVAAEKPAANKIDTKAFGNLNALFGKKAPPTESAEPEQKPAGKINTAAFGGLNALFAKKAPPESEEAKPETVKVESKRRILLAQGPNVLAVPDIDLREHMPELPDASSVEAEIIGAEKPAANKIDTKAFGNLNALFAKKAPPTESAEPEQKPSGKINAAAFGGLNALFAKKAPPTNEEVKAPVEAKETVKPKILLAQGPNVLPVPDIDLREHMPDLPQASMTDVEIIGAEKPAANKIDTKAFGNLNALFAKKAPPTESVEPEQKPAGKINAAAFGGLNALFAKKAPPAAEEAKSDVPTTDQAPKKSLILLAKGPNVLPVPDINLREHMPELPDASSVEVEIIGAEKPAANKIDTKAFGNLNALFAKKAPPTESAEPEQKPAGKINTAAFGGLNALFAKKAPPTEGADSEPKPAGKINAGAFGGLNALFAKKAPPTNDAPASAPAAEGGSQETSKLAEANKINNSVITLGESSKTMPVPNANLKLHMPNLVTVADLKPANPWNIPNSNIVLGPNVLPVPNIDLKIYMPKQGQEPDTTTEQTPPPKPAPKLDLGAIGNLNALFAGKGPAPTAAAKPVTANATPAQPANAIRAPTKGLVSKKAHINALPKYKMQGTFWTSTVGPGPGLKTISLDFEKLEEIFFQKAEEAEKSTKVQSQPKSQMISLLEAKKVNNTSIVLSSFGKNTDEVVDIIGNCDDKLGLEQLQKIASILPTEEEKKTLDDYKDDLNKISPAERFLKKLVVVPRLTNRVQAMVFRLNFDHDFEDYTENMLVLNYPFTLLKTEKRFQYVLQLLLQICNFMNFGTPKANAAGFTLDCLTNLDTLKGFDKKTSPLIYLVTLVKSQDEGYFDFIGDFLTFDKATKFEVADFDKKLKEFQDGINKIKEECANIRTIMETTTDQATLQSYQSFLDRFEPFIQEGTIKAGQFEKNLKSLKDDILKVGQLYAENKEYKTKAFLGTLINFAQTLKGIKMKLEEKPKEPPKEKPKPAAPVAAAVKQPIKTAHEIVGHNKAGAGANKAHATYKERASITMRNTIRQLRKDLQHTKMKDTMIFKPEHHEAEKKEGHGKDGQAHQPRIMEPSKNFKVAKNSGVISFH